MVDSGSIKVGNKVGNKVDIMHLPELASLHSYLIISTNAMKFTRFYPYFSFCYIVTFIFDFLAKVGQSSQDKILQVLLAFVLHPSVI